MRPVARCIHFTPNLGACKAGIEKRSVAHAGLLPCLTLHGYPDRRAACAKYEPVADEILDAEARQLREAVARFERSRCPHCGAALARSEDAHAVAWICPVHSEVARGCKSIDPDVR